MLRAADTGIANMWVPMVMVGMNLVFSAACYPFGKLADHVSAEKLLTVSLVLLAASDFTFAFVSSVRGTVAGGAVVALVMLLMLTFKKAEQTATA